MRVLVVSDTIAPLSSAAAGRELAAGWSAHDVVVVPIGEAGAGWLQASADLVGEPVALLPGRDDTMAMMVAGGDTLAVALEPVAERAGGSVDWSAGSAALGQAVRTAVGESARPRRLAVDLTGPDALDGGAGLLGALGAVADGPLESGVGALAQISLVDLDPVRELLAGIELVGIVPETELNRHLLGLRGIVSLAGREADADTAEMLAADDALGRFVAAASPETATDAGAGACGGLGWAIRALGGRITTGPAYVADRLGLTAVCDQADLIVTGCSSYDFASRGGGVVAAAARWAEQAMTPCIAIAGEVLIGTREMRTMGIEAAYPVWATGAARGDDPVADVRATAQRVARSWTW